MGTHYGIRPQGNVSYKNTFYVLVDTNGRSDGLTTVELNINESVGGDRYIDWGDGTVEIVNTSLPSHTYAEHGEYEIFAWGGTTTRLGERDNSPNVGWTQTIKTVRCGSEFGFTNMRGAFRSFAGTLLDVSNLNTTNVTNMVIMFGACSSLTSLDVSNFDTSSVTDMGDMFGGCSSLTALDLSNFDTSSVTDMIGMFAGCSSLTSLGLSNFDTSSVTDMSYMFYFCQSLTSLDVSSFDTSLVTNMFFMFRDVNGLLTDIVGVEDFNIEGLNSTSSLTAFIFGPSLPTARYDALLINWDAQDPLDGLSPFFTNSQYTAGGAAEAARTSLINGDGWTITDGGSV